jgi:GNAT superfamily N-acetyltransferase
MQPKSDPTIRAARLPEDPELHALSLRSKAHWGYDAAFMAKAVPLLALKREWYDAGRILVADLHGRPAGVGAILAPDHHGVSELAHLFVDPPCMGRGIGGTLLAHLLARARSDGARRATVLSDPFARHFSERLGARFVRDDPSEGVDGRALPVLAWEFPG